MISVNNVLGHTGCPIKNQPTLDSRHFISVWYFLKRFEGEKSTKFGLSINVQRVSKNSRQNTVIFTFPGRDFSKITSGIFKEIENFWYWKGMGKRHLTANNKPFGQILYINGPQTVLNCLTNQITVWFSWPLFDAKNISVFCGPY